LLLSLALRCAEALGNSVVAAKSKLDRVDLVSQATQHLLQWLLLFAVSEVDLSPHLSTVQRMEILFQKKEYEHVF
jgi:hypothetical protein